MGDNTDPIKIISYGHSVTDYAEGLHRCGYQFRDNVLKGIEWSKEDEQWRQLCKADYASIFAEVQQRCIVLNAQEEKPKPFGLNVTRDQYAILATAKGNRYHPTEVYFQQLLENLPDDYNGDYEAEQLMTKLFGFEHHCYSDNNIKLEEVISYASKCLMNLILGVIHRTIAPGSVHDYLQVWISDIQGVGKSVTLSLLLPKWTRAYVGGISPNTDKRDLTKMCQRASIVEYSEMIGATAKETARFKDIISDSSPVAVDKYEVDAHETLIHYVPVGTSNDDEVNNYDPTDPRRSIPLYLSPLKGVNPTYEEIEATMELWRDRIWMHGLWLYAQGKRGRHDDDELWSDRDREIRSVLANDTRKSPLLIDQALFQILADPQEWVLQTGEVKNNHDKVLKHEERKKGIPLGSKNTPSNVRTVLRLLNPRVAQSPANIQAIRATMIAQGWQGLEQRKSPLWRKIDGKSYRVVKPPSMKPAPTNPPVTIVDEKGEVVYDKIFKTTQR